jgi:ParB family chromosome partitioning protein
MSTKRPSGLGRGLGALIPQRISTGPTAAQQAPQIGAKPAAAPAVSAVRDGAPFLLDHVLIDTNPDQPRSTFGHHELEDLANSIREHGILQPLTVAPKGDGRYELIAGERRFRAAKLVGLTQVPVTIRKENDERTRFVLALIENIQREDLNPLEEARAYERLTTEFGLTQDEVSKQVGKARSTVANAMRLLDLPQEIQDALAAGAVSPGNVRALIGIKDPKQQMALFRKLLSSGMSARDVEAGARSVKGGGRKDPALTAAEEELRKTYGTKVTVTSMNGKGKIAFDFYSEEEFNGMVRRLLTK